VELLLQWILNNKDLIVNKDSSLATVHQLFALTSQKLAIW
jgi:hypothetical protein